MNNAHQFWQTKSGKLLIGGCGTQIGMVLTIGTLALTLLACALCGMLNIATLAGPQLAAGPSPTPIIIVEANGDSTEEVAALQAKIGLLANQVEELRRNPPVAPTPTPTPHPPVVIADKGGVNLRSAPDVNAPWIGRLENGGMLQIFGRNQDSSWWLVATPSGSLAWVADDAISTAYVDDSLPVVTIPALLVQPSGDTASRAAPPSTPLASTNLSGDFVPQPANAVLPPVGTPTAPASESRRFVQDTRGYLQLIRRLLLPTVSESFSPDGQFIAITEQISLYTITTDGNTRRVLLADDPAITIVGGAVWSPDGRYLALVVDRVQDCQFCREVWLVRLGDDELIPLQSPPEANLDLPRWTQDGQLLVTAYGIDPTLSAIYLYDVTGQGQPASGSYQLSSSHSGQKWFPWQPGKHWSVGGADSYTLD